MIVYQKFIYKQNEYDALKDNKRKLDSLEEKSDIDEWEQLEKWKIGRRNFP